MAWQLDWLGISFSDLEKAEQALGGSKELSIFRLLHPFPRSFFDLDKDGHSPGGGKELSEEAESFDLLLSHSFP